jgi:hypothetical protein
MTATLKLIHLANFNSTNIGNGALITGLEKRISEDFKAKVDWVLEAWDDYTFGYKQFDHNFVELVNNSDGLIVNGAVAIHGREYLSKTGMRFELPLNLVDEIKKPLVFYGISYRHFRNQPFHHADTLKNYLKALVLNSKVFFGVRNDGTKKWFKETLKLDTESLAGIYEVPDTGVFTAATWGDYPEILSNKKVIIFAPNDEDAANRFGDANVLHVKETGYQLPADNSKIAVDDSWIKNRENLVQQLKIALTRILKESGGQLLIVPHYLDDYKFITSLIEAFEPQVAHQCSIATGLMRVQGTGYFYGRYLQADLAISMRVHSMSPCIGLGVPMIPLITQPRMWDFLKTTGLEDLGVDAFTGRLDEELFNSMLGVLRDPALRRRRFKTAWAEMRETAGKINTRIEQLFNRSN